MENKNLKLENDLFNQFKKDIAIINFKKSYNKSNIKFLTTLKRTIISILSLVGIGGITAFAYTNIRFQPINNMNISYALIKDAVDNGYIENMNMSYIYSNDIGVKINSLLMSDDKIDIVFDFDFNENILPQNKLNIAMIIYDECKNIYYIWDTPNNILRNKLYKNNYYRMLELSNENYINATQSFITLYQSENKYIGELSLCSSEKYPKVKKLYINIYDIGYNENTNDKYKSLFNNVNWSFEIDVPEQFYNRTSLHYNLKDKNEIIDFDLVDLNITETGTVLTYQTRNNFPLNINIIDENDKVYTSNGAILLNENSNMYTFENQYTFSKYLITDNLFLHIEDYDVIMELRKDS